MAAVYIPTVKKTVGSVAHIVEPNEISDGFAFTTVSDTTNGAYLARTFDSDNAVEDEFKDAKTNIVIYNSGGSEVTVTFKAGDSYAACNDLAVKVDAGKYAFIQIDSAYFKIVNTDAGIGTVHIVPSASVDVAVIENR